MPHDTVHQPAAGHTDASRLDGIEVLAFDAYGTLFDVHAAAGQCRDALGDKADRLSQLWRQKQLEYTWLRSLMGDYDDFWHVTGEALDYAMAAAGLDDLALRARLMEIYLHLDAYPEVVTTLAALKATKRRTAILSNGSPTMLISAARNAGIDDHLDRLLSADAVRIYKPHPSVYQLVPDAFGVPAGAVCFLSSNGWDVAGAAHFGFRAVWINRFGMTAESLPGKPVDVIARLDELPALLGR